MSSGEYEKGTSQHFETYPLQGISEQVHKRTTGHGEPLTSVMFESNLFHDRFRDRAVLVTLCFRPEVLALQKSKKEKGERKKNFPINPHLTAVLTGLATSHRK